MYLINCCGLNSTHTVHQGLLCCVTLYITFLWDYTSHTLTKFLWGATCLVCNTNRGAAVHRPNVLWSTPPIQKSTTKTTWVESPPMLKIAQALQIFSIVLLHCTLPKSIVQAYHQVQTSVDTVPYIKGTRVGGILLKCEIPVPPWELVLCCMCTPLKWSRLVLTSLRIVTHQFWGGQFGQFKVNWARLLCWWAW